MGNWNSGRRPQPTTLKILRGITRRDRLNLNEPISPLGEVVKPTDLSPGAIAVWDTVSAALSRDGDVDRRGRPRLHDALRARGHVRYLAPLESGPGTPRRRLETRARDRADPPPVLRLLRPRPPEPVAHQGPEGGRGAGEQMGRRSAIIRSTFKGLSDEEWTDAAMRSLTDEASSSDRGHAVLATQERSHAARAVGRAQRNQGLDGCRAR